MKTISSFSSKLLALTLALMASVSTFAYNFGDDGLFFNIIDYDNKLVEVTYQHERSEENYSKLTHVTIPDTVLRGRVKYAVVSIGNMAFYKCKTLESIVIPDHIKSIGTNAFSECSALTSVSLPNTITYLNSSLFSNCTALRTFTIPDNITSIYGSVFESCSSLSEINIPSSVTSIGKYAFRYCNSLKSITIPNSVKSIYRGAFYKCKALTDITLPDSLTTVSQEMFYECTALESITIPIGVTHIENKAFYWCSNLKTMTLHANIEYIDEWAFSQTEISTFVLAMKNAEEACNNRVNKILHNIGQQYATRKITIAGEKVRDLVVPNIVDSISDYAFAYSYIASVDIPNNLKRINPTAFYKCPSLQTVHWNALDFEEVSSAANAPFNKVASQIHTFKFGRDIKHIPAYLCYDMNRLDSIEIPAGVKSIGKHAFAHCSPSVVICHASQVPNIDESAFSKDYVSNTILYVPAESVETYKDSEQWNKFAHIVAIGEEINDTDSDWDWWLVHDFAVDNFGYAIIENATTPSVQIIEAVGKSGHIDIPTEVIHNDTLYKVTGLGTGIVTTFRYSPDLTSVFIPKEILLVNNAVFADCPNLESIVVEEGNVHQDSRDNCNAVIRNLYADRSPELVIGCKNTTIPDGVLSIGSYAFRGCKGLQEIEVPSSVTTIYQNAFYDCISLKSVVLGENITSINDLAFYNCYNLEKVVCLALTPPSKGASAFNNTPITDPDIEERAPIYVPDASVEIYKQAWKNYNIQPLSSISSYKSQWCDTWNVLDLKYRTIKYTTKEDFETWRYYLAQDTIINNYTYTAVTRQTTKVPEGVYPFTIPEPEYVAAVRFTDDRKVYIYYDNTEYLLYDFNVQPGDELTVFAGINHYHSHHTNTIRVAEVERYPGIYPFGTEISLSVFPDFYGDERPTCFGVTKWVEGVGDLCGFITGADCGLSEYQTALLCAYKDGNTEYTTENEEYAEYGCEYNSGENKEYILTLPGLQRTVCNEYCGDTEDDNSANFTYKQTFDSIFFENDKPYILCNGYLLREEDNKIFLYSQSLNKDIVLYDFTLEVGDSLPAYIKDFDGTMYSGDTLVVTDISSVTLLDSKEYKKWTFDNGMEYVEGIGMYGGHRNGNFFGLIQEIVVPCHTGTHFVCASRNGQLLYQMDNAEMERLGAECLCDYDSGHRKDNAKDGQIGGRPTPTQWNQLEVVLREMDNNHTILQAETFSYTLEDISQQVNNKTYFQLARQSTKDTATTKSVVGALHFGKDEDNRVYFLRDGVEYVLYDFTAEPGDTVEIFAGINNYPQETTYTHVVTGKDTLENGACRMLLEVVFPDETNTTTENAEKVWLAGLGSVDGIVHNAAKRASNAHVAPNRSADSNETESSVMLCAWREDSCLYTTDHPDYDSFGCVYNQDPTSVENTHSPLPMTDYQKLLRNGQLLIIHKGKTYNVLGVAVE